MDVRDPPSRVRARATRGSRASRPLLAASAGSEDFSGFQEIEGAKPFIARFPFIGPADCQHRAVIEQRRAVILPWPLHHVPRQLPAFARWVEDLGTFRTVPEVTTCQEHRPILQKRRGGR